MKRHLITLLLCALWAYAWFDFGYKRGWRAQAGERVLEGAPALLNSLPYREPTKDEMERFRRGRKKGGEPADVIFAYENYDRLIQYYRPENPEE